MQTNNVSSFFYYMWNAWNESECEIVFQSCHCGWMHVWSKWCEACNVSRSAWGATELFYKELGEELRDMLVERACSVYNRNQRIN